MDGYRTFAEITQECVFLGLTKAERHSRMPVGRNRCLIEARSTGAAGALASPCREAVAHVCGHALPTALT
jgi:hypothetical protein